MRVRASGSLHGGMDLDESAEDRHDSRVDKSRTGARSRGWNKMADIVVLGAGASGLMCGIAAGKRGRSVVILEHTDRIGNKILISGGGRCNFTNLTVDSEDYISGNPRFCTSALARFSQYDIISMVESHRIQYHEEDRGKLFCDRSARDIVEMLDKESREAGVEIKCRSEVSGIERDGDRFVVATNRGNIRGTSIVVATGGLSYPKAGATPLGYEIARRFGVAVARCRPALVPFRWSERDLSAFGDLSGIALTARLSTRAAEFDDRVLFTHRGLSGPAALQLSSYWGSGDPVCADFLPDTDTVSRLMEERRRGIELGTVLGRLLPKRLVRSLYGDLIAGKPLSRCTDSDIARISERLHGFCFIPGGTEGYDKAEATGGGVSTDECSSKTMEAKAVPGLYFTGEVLDVTGRLGGYNLQWAWSSGHAAGTFA